MIWIDYAFIGLLAGFLAGYIGIGGGLVLVPALSWLFSLDPATSEFAVHMAVATSLATMLVTSLSSIFAHHQHRAIMWPITIALSLGLAAGAIAGAILAARLSTDHLAAIFGSYAALAGLQIISGREVENHKRLPGRTGSGMTGLAIGTVSALVGIGGGSMTVPWLLWHGRRAQQAVATASACGYPIALAGTVTFIVLGQQQGLAGNPAGYVHLPALAGVVLFSVLSAPLGAAAVHRSPPALVRRIFGVFMLLVAWRMLF